MPHPKKRSTRTSRKTRAAHFALLKKQLSVCPECKVPKKQHYACPKCGKNKKK